jgi:quercetin dioxygenase-like cupin family protein
LEDDMKEQPRVLGRHTRIITAAAGVALFVGALALTSVTPRAAGAARPPIDAVPLGTARTTFTDGVGIDIRLAVDGRAEQVIQLADASHVAVLEITVQPGAAFPWHTHPGPALAGVQRGALVYVYADDCVRRPYPAGTTFVDPGGENVHLAFNPSETEEAVVVVTFLGVPAEGGLTMPVDDEAQVALDEACTIER